ncbi:hypothetical protein VW35_05995 [Devosia soli]|uniref:Uncharacterized protein n=1 Tax=Devosia soli TaxID=361041 RepID=A0A0F5LCS2_9HYPH|nr:hypothetical protein [Devosia soli]KKB80004.1 hypothetical protein VW35_05995 [Devosia soli]
MKFAVLAATLLFGMSIAPAVLAKDATCFTTDDGEYDCVFERLDDAGSFRIEAEGKPTFEMWIEEDGKGFASAVFEAGGRSVPLPGTYYRSEDDGACWESDATDTEICAW